MTHLRSVISHYGITVLPATWQKWTHPALTQPYSHTLWYTLCNLLYSKSTTNRSNGV